jgi:hypothetical protein
MSHRQGVVSRWTSVTANAKQAPSLVRRRGDLAVTKPRVHRSMSLFLSFLFLFLFLLFLLLLLIPLLN